MIQLVKHADIDFVKWDTCISLAQHSEIYAYSWFLDCVSPQWQALVLNDYEAVMPLPIKSKYGMRYFVQPPFCQKLGIFSPHILSAAHQKGFLKQFSRTASIRYASFHNFYPPYSSSRDNYIVHLNKSATDIESLYNKNTIRNIKKTEQEEVESHEISIETFVPFFLSTLHYSIPQLYIRSIQSLLEAAQKNNALCCIGAFKDETLLSSVAFFMSEKRYYYLLAASNTEGKNLSAMFSIIHTFITDKANTNAVLDFEGSEIPGVAQFYKGFGAVNEPYFIIERHKIPLLGKFIK